LFVVVALLVLGAGLGLRDPWPSDEPRFALVAKQMVDSGYWLFPHRGTELYSDKPPMLMWWQASLYGLVGHWRVAFLLPSLLAALGTLWCVVDLGRRLWTRQVGLYAGWALLFALQFTFQAKKAQIDPLLVLFITLANYGLLRHLLLGPAWRWWWLGWFFAGIGVITKGVGMLALLMIVPAAIAAALQWPRFPCTRAMRFWLAPLAFLLAVSLWLAPMLLAGWAPARTSTAPTWTTSCSGRRRGATRSPGTITSRGGTSWRRCRDVDPGVPGAALGDSGLAPPAAPPRRALPAAAGLVAAGGAVLLDPHGKRDVYILPALPMFCLALAPLLPGLLKRRDVQAVVGCSPPAGTGPGLAGALACWATRPSSCA
jgi:4-amino-4-deoxy-L-arabinose transferase-like glycosyltransferase